MFALREKKKLVGSRPPGEQPGLGGVIGVDADVFVREVSCPEPAGARSLVKIDRDRVLGLSEVGVRGGFVELFCAGAASADGQFAEGDIDRLGIDLCAGVPDGGYQSAPVRIATRPGSFDQRRVGDGFRDAQRFGVGGSAVDLEFNDV